MPVDKYEVGLTYCNDQNFTHHHMEVGEATGEYGKLLGEAIEPELSTPDSKHLRMVSLVARDETGRVVQHVNSGTFGCTHRDD